MFGFFYSIYYSLFAGGWTSYDFWTTLQQLKDTWKDLANWVMNALGGNFATLQDFTWTNNPIQMTALMLALITCVSVCLGVWKLIKAVFSIFFGRT